MTESSDEFAVLCFCANGDAQTVQAELHPMTVAHDDSAIHQLIVNLRGVCHLGEEEVCIGRIDHLADGQQLEGFDHP